MNKKLHLILIVTAFFGIAALASVLMPQNAFAGVGSSGGGSGGSGGAQSTYGFGWYQYSSSSSGPGGYKNGGPWSFVSATCRAENAPYVISFIVQTSARNPSRAVVYNYTPATFNQNWPGYIPSGNGYIPMGTAQSLFTSLGAQNTQGYTFGVNVAWFCYNPTPPPPPPTQWLVEGITYIQNSATPNRNAAVNGTISAKPGDRLNWFHDLRNFGPQNMDRDIYYEVAKTGFNNGWDGIRQPLGNARGGTGYNFVQLYARAGAPSDPYTLYDVQQSDVGNTLCQRIQWIPHFTGSPDAGANTFACANIPYSYALTPDITNITDGATIQSALGNRAVNGKVTNSGDTKSHTGIQQQITQIKFAEGATLTNKAGGVSSGDPCAYYGGAIACSSIEAGTDAAGFAQNATKGYAGTGNVGNENGGSRVCYAMSVKRNSSSDTNWRHSKMYCQTVAYSYALVPDVTSVTDGDIIDATSAMPVVSRVVNSGLTNSHANIQWRVTQVEYKPGVTIVNKPGGVSTTTPCTYFSGSTLCTSTTAGSGTEAAGYARLATKQYSSTANINGKAGGTRFCYAMSVMRHTSANNTEWRHSKLYCVTPYDYTLTPEISDIEDGGMIESSTGALPVTGRVVNNGTTKSHTNIRWQITQVKYAPGAAIPNQAGGFSPSIPCTYFGSTLCGATTSGSGTETAGYADNDVKSYISSTTIGNEAVGTRICYAMSVIRNAATTTANPTTGTQWKHSQLYCMTVGKKPKVQVLGGDLSVGRGAGVVSNVTTSMTRLASGITYGSWAEYGIVASGTVLRMASAAGNAGGSNIAALCNLSILTFTNSTSGACNPTSVGRYSNSSIAGNIASRFEVSATTKNISAASVNLTSATPSANMSGLYKSSVPNLSIAAGSGDIDAGRYIVINAPLTTVTIDSDIRYTTGAITGVTSIPQLVIIAKNIIVSDDVTNVDSWLIASGTGLDGKLNTCGAGTWLRGATTVTITETSPVLSTHCDKKLTVNGPVSANHLVLRRTGGAGTGTPQQAAEPAEVFNLRPDAYFWAAAYATGPSSRVPVASTKELPPRF